MLDVDSDGQVTLHDIRDAVLTVYRVRHSTALCPRLVREESMIMRYRGKGLDQSRSRR